jgi:hypothetical protein
LKLEIEDYHNIPSNEREKRTHLAHAVWREKLHSANTVVLPAIDPDAVTLPKLGPISDEEDFMEPYCRLFCIMSLLMDLCSDEQLNNFIQHTNPFEFKKIQHNAAPAWMKEGKVSQAYLDTEAAVDGARSSAKYFTVFWVLEKNHADAKAAIDKYLPEYVLNDKQTSIADPRLFSDALEYRDALRNQFRLWTMLPGGRKLSIFRL